jgi:Glycosyl transferases group 1
MKILLIRVMQEAHLYNRFLDALATALRELGNEITVSDQSGHVVAGVASSHALVRQLEHAPPDAVLSFSSFFGGLEFQDGSSLYDRLGIKFLGWQFDHPIYARDSLKRALQHRYSIYCNHNHLRFAQAIKLPGQGMTLLAGGEAPAGPVPEFRRRQWPIFVAATFNGTSAALWNQLEDSTGKRLLLGVIEELSVSREASLLDAFDAAARKLGFNAALGNDPEFDDQIIALLREALTHVRNLDRIAVIRGLADSGLPLTLCGSGWRDFLGEHHNVTYLDQRVDFRELTALFGHAKIVLNLNAGNGGCERALYSAMAGAAVVSDDSEDLLRQFGGPDEITFFDRTRPGSVVETVRHLIDGDEGEAMAARGQEAVMRTGLWRHRAEQMVRFLGT